MATAISQSLAVQAIQAVPARFSRSASSRLEKPSVANHARIQRRLRRLPILHASHETSSSAPSGDVGATAVELLEPEHEAQLAEVARLLSVSTSASANGGAASGGAADVQLGEAAAGELVRQLDHAGRAALLTALFPGSTDKHDAALEFQAADVNHDGVLDSHEFATYVEAQNAKMEAADRPLNVHQLGLLATRSAIGNIGFGVTDNTIMIIAGDIIEGTLGAAFGISTLMAAGLGNAVSDIIGTIFREYIEGATGHFLPDVNFSSKQLADSRARWAETGGATVGVTIGCLLGLAPLLVLKQRACHGGSDGGDAAAAAGVPVPVATVAQVECGEGFTAAATSAGAADEASEARMGDVCSTAGATAGATAGSVPGAAFTRGVTAHASISAAQWMGPSPIFRPLPLAGPMGERGGLGVALVLALSALNVARRVRGVFMRRGGERRGDGERKGVEESQ
ncbi:hypothetical protein CLOM_g2132 [Closterium sp. NIES-68]|nr:hypothetical protein CLOM_g2132 [Closterium sp. NIES-68]GJP70819.1 hypothetical protein CLOP_g1715 [Closterium sp. NIES-67]